MVDRKIPAFFPPDKFDGQNKTLTKQHWQIFKDFCDQQKLNFEDIPATPDTEAIPAQTDKNFRILQNYSSWYSPRLV